MARVCIICYKELKRGIPVKEDAVLKGIRWGKNLIRSLLERFGMKVSKGNVLVVCEEHVEESRKRREKFERTLLTFGGLGVILGLILIIVSILSGRDLFGIATSILLLIFLVAIFAAMSLLQYHPALEYEIKKGKEIVRKRKAKRRRV